MYNDALSEVIHNSVIQIMGVLYVSGLVETANMAAMMRLFNVGSEICERYADMEVEFDEDFFIEYERITGFNLRSTNSTVH